MDAVQRRLAERGFAIGRSTLSYWQNGHRLPTQPTSLLAVTALEEILPLIDGAAGKLRGERVSLCRGNRGGKGKPLKAPRK